jgi:inorganic triphosphatase YgiF
VYFDTPKLDLHRSSMALRLRRKGKNYLQTLKGGGAIHAGLHQRNEWEVPVQGEALEFNNTQFVDWDKLLPVAWRATLQPVFVTDFLRSSRIVSWQGAHIEVCMDHGQISAGDLSHEICELELELKSGSPQQLFGLALAILEIVPFDIEMVNKAEYGFRLLNGATDQPSQIEFPLINPQNSLAQGLQTAIFSNFLHFQKSWRGVLAGDDVEFLHQARVALRRLRVLLKLAQRGHADKNLACFAQQFADLSVMLGQVRDWDVFVAEYLRLQSKVHVRALLAESLQRRSLCLARLSNQAAEVQSLMLRFALWMYGDYWLALNTHQPDARHFATHRLNNLRQHFSHSLVRIDEHNPLQLHELRILSKKLRYSSEFFRGYFEAKHCADFLTALAEAQEVLGGIHDATEAYRLLDELFENVSESSPTRTALFDAITESRRRHLCALPKVLKHFNQQAIFW